MRGTIFVAALLLGLGAQPAVSQTNPSAPTAVAAPAADDPPIWSVGPDRLLFGPAGISVPRRAATVEHYETREFSHQGEGLDTVLQLRSADHAVFASVYVYLPSVSHAGLQAIATDAAIQTNPKGGGKLLRSGTASVGGKAGLALTADYSGYLGSLFTTSAFVKAGRWMVKIRVSGPQPREAEVSSVLKALLDGLKFEGAYRPRPALPLEAGECAASASGGGDARLLEDKDHGIGAALFAQLDAAGEEATGKGAAHKAVPPRIGRTWCRSVLQVGDARAPLLRAVSGDRNNGRGARSELFVLYSDAGGMLEVVGLPAEKKHVLLNHAIGETLILGTFDAVPSDRQLRQLFTQPGENGRVRASIVMKANGESELRIAAPDKPGS